MKGYKIIIYLIIIFIGLVGCKQFPTKQLSLNLANQQMPIMLSPIKNELVETHVFELSSEYYEYNYVLGSGRDSQSFSDSFNMTKNLTEQFIDLPSVSTNWYVIDSFKLSVKEKSSFNGYNRKFISNFVIKSTMGNNK